MSHTPTDPIKSTAAQILALPYPEGMTGNQQRAFDRGLEAAAIVEAMPAQLTVKPLVWMNAGDGWGKAYGLGCEYWAEVGEDVSRQQADHDARILAAIDLTPTAIAVSPAADPAVKLADALAAERVIWTQAIEIYFDATAVMDVEKHVERLRAEGRGARDV